MSWQTILAIDFDKWAAETYRANFPGVRVECGAVADYIDDLPAADVVLGGPPCQPYSIAGDGDGANDGRDGLPDFVAAVLKVRPRQFLMENVPGLLAARHIGHLQKATKQLDREGYEIQFRVLDAVDYGVPQFRKRLWVWGISKVRLAMQGAWFNWPRPTHAWPPPAPCMYGAELEPGVTVRQALGLEGAIRRIRGSGVVRRDHPTDEPCPTVMQPTGGKAGLMLVMGGGRNHPKGADGKYRRDKRDITDEPSTTITDYNGATTPFLAIPRTLDKPSPTISAGWHTGGPEPVNNSVREGFLRRLTPLECLRLQSGPDSFLWPEKISKSAMYKVVGNGWACGMAAVMSRAMKATDPASETVIDLFCGGGLGACGWHGRAWRYEPETEAA